MKLLVLIALALPLAAAEPDWQTLEPYAVSLLQRFVQIPSINPPADTKAAAEFMKAELEAVGIAVKLYDAGEGKMINLVARIPGKDKAKKPLLLLNHLDVVPVDRKAWGTVNPFSGEVKDGFIWGRGTLDMKGIGVMHMMAMITMKKMGLVPEREVIMLASCDEETGGEKGVKWMLANHAADIDAEFVLDEGGLGTRDVFREGKLVYGISVAEKQPLWIRLRAAGTAAHGSQPIADNANMILYAALAKAMALPEGAKANDVVEAMRKASGGEFAEGKFTSAIQKNTMTLTTLRSGVGDPPKINVIPSVAEATIDCRLLPGTNADEFVSELKARINDTRVTVELTNTPPGDPGTSNYETGLFRVLKQVILKYHPEAEVTPMLVPYSTDSTKFRTKGLPAYGFTPLVLPGKILATMHSDAERIPLDQFYTGVRMMFDVLRSEF